MASLGNRGASRFMALLKMALLVVVTTFIINSSVCLGAAGHHNTAEEFIGLDTKGLINLANPEISHQDSEATQRTTKNTMATTPQPSSHGTATIFLLIIPTCR
ncbi:hypothetical protein VPH35_034695 [Triticum aestivum]|uniref:Uncharacterized protein n=1 Tax=Aegilops tauschii TaxID=37682 RepID=M8BIE9_AEGTA